MAQFSKILGALLNDLISAQYEADVYTTRLRGEYGKNGKSIGFTPPRATIQEIELNLNYGIKDGVTECMTYETDFRKLHSFLKDFSFQSAKIIISTILSSVKPSDVAEDADALRIWSLLSKDNGGEYRKLLAYLSRKIYGELVGETEIFLDGQGSVLAGPLVTALCNVTRNGLLQLPDVEMLFCGNDVKVRTEMLKTLAGTLAPFVSQLVSEENFIRERVLPSADVVVETNSLEKLPAECIHSIRLKLSLPGYSQYVEPDKKE